MNLVQSDPGLLDSSASGAGQLSGEVGTASFMRLWATDKDRLRAWKEGALLRKPTLLNAAQPTTSFSSSLSGRGISLRPHPSPSENTGRQGGFRKNFTAAKNNGATHISFPVFYNFKYPKEGAGEGSGKMLENIYIQ